MSNSKIPPSIFKETSEGLVRCAIQDKMLLQREIDVIGEITIEHVNSIILQLCYLSNESPKEEITLYINSQGGDFTSGLSLYDILQAIECPIRTVCMGIAASMAALLFACGDKREMLCHSQLMIHDPLISFMGGSALKIHAISQDIMRARELASNILAKHTGRNPSEILEKTAKDTYFDAEQAIAFGLADSILTKI